MFKNVTKYILAKKEQREQKKIEKLCKEAATIYEYTENFKKGWMGDTERFMAFTAVHTKNLIKHSITLAILTCVLIGLTVANIILLIKINP